MMRVLIVLLLAAFSSVSLTATVEAQGTEKIRVGLPTKSYWSTIAVVTAEKRGLFKKEGLDPEVTIFRSAGEAFQALAAGAVDITLGAPSLAAAGRSRGANALAVALGNSLPLGWYLVTKKDAPFQSVKDLDGKKVAVTGTGSLSVMMVNFAAQEQKVRLDLLPVGGGVVPNLRAGNVDAAMLWPPLSYQLLDSGEVRALYDFTQALPKMALDPWMASEKIVKEKPAVVQKAVNALMGAVALLQSDREFALKLIAETYEVPANVATAEYERTILKLPNDGAITEDVVAKYLDFAKLAGITDMAPAATITDTRFKAVPTKP
jgi:NitT/TauT family transport system substrate-binding protein